MLLEVKAKMRLDEDANSTDLFNEIVFDLKTSLVGFALLVNRHKYNEVGNYNRTIRYDCQAIIQDLESEIEDKAKSLLKKDVENSEYLNIGSVKLNSYSIRFKKEGG